MDLIITKIIIIIEITKNKKSLPRCYICHKLWYKANTSKYKNKNKNKNRNKNIHENKKIIQIMLKQIM